MQNKYCLPIIKPGQKAVLETIENTIDNYGYFEIWIDYIEDFDNVFITDLVNKYPGRIVVVFRRQKLQPIKMPVSQRLKILDGLSAKDCLIDLDITCQNEDLNYIDENKLKIKKIVSYHNYDETPDNEKLAGIAAEIKSRTPYIFKISAMCNSASDALRLIGIKKDLLENGEKHIILGMGKDGEITRVFGALWANALIFIPETLNEASAPGQISRADFDKIMKRVNQ